MTKDEVNILIDFVVILSKKGNKVKPPAKMNESTYSFFRNIPL